VSAEERAVLDAAVDGGYDVEGPSPGFERLVERLPEDPVPESGRRWYIEYEDARYGRRLDWTGCPSSTT
jgi:hypothetical protein